MIIFCLVIPYVEEKIRVSFTALKSLSAFLLTLSISEEVYDQFIHNVADTYYLILNFLEYS